MATCLIGVGSNAGDRERAVDFAIEALPSPGTISVIRRSRRYHTAPVGGPAQQPQFINAAFLVETTLEPHNLLRLLQSIEQQAGRTAGPRWGERTLDLDLLLYDKQEINSRDLIIPHPRMAFRRFVLEPAAEIAGDLLHPRIRRNVRQLLDHLDTAANYVAVTGPPGVGKTEFVERLCQQTGATPLVDDVEQGFDPTSPTLRAELEFFNDRLNLLQDVGLPPEEVWISDFWIDQSRVYAKQSLSENEIREFEKVRREEQFQVIMPKLLVLLENRNPVPNPIQLAFSELATRPGLPPVLKLAADDADWNEQEVAAAIQAMQ